MSSAIDIFKDTFTFLEQNIDKNFYCEDFQKSHTKKLYDTLLKKTQQRGYIKKSL